MGSGKVKGPSERKLFSRQASNYQRCIGQDGTDIGDGLFLFFFGHAGKGLIHQTDIGRNDAGSDDADHAALGRGQIFHGEISSPCGKELFQFLFGSPDRDPFIDHSYVLGSGKSGAETVILEYDTDI